MDDGSHTRLCPTLGLGRKGQGVHRARTTPGGERGEGKSCFLKEKMALAESHREDYHRLALSVFPSIQNEKGP